MPVVLRQSRQRCGQCSDRLTESQSCSSCQQPASGLYRYWLYGTLLSALLTAASCVLHAGGSERSRKQHHSTGCVHQPSSSPSSSSPVSAIQHCCRQQARRQRSRCCWREHAGGSGWPVQSSAASRHPIRWRCPVGLSLPSAAEAMAAVGYSSAAVQGASVAHGNESQAASTATAACRA